MDVLKGFDWARHSLSVLLHVLERQNEWAWLQDEQRVKPLVALRPLLTTASATPHSAAFN